MAKYKDWEIFDSLPNGWKIDTATGSPLAGYLFCINGKSILSGLQKRALVKIDQKIKTNKKNKEIIKQEASKKSTSKETILTKKAARPFNNLARKAMIAKILTDIRLDLAICEVEGWSKTEYLEEIRKSLCSLGVKNGKQ